MSRTAPDNSAVISVDGLSTRYGTRDILSDVSFEVNRNEVFVIMGASGSGKSTLLRHVLALEQGHAGEVEMLGQRPASLSRRELLDLRKQIGVAFQGGALFSSMSVVENVELPLKEHTRLDGNTMRIMSRMKLELMNLGNAEDLMPAQLSGGMTKRAGLARACIMDPQILFFDEPSAGLDPVTSAELDELILKLRDALRITVVVVTHELESAFKIADRIMIIDAGRVRAVGTVDQIRASDDAVVQDLLNRRPRASEMDGEAYIDRLTAGGGRTTW